jgi:voltage-gated potassium channel Kch
MVEPEPSRRGRRAAVQRLGGRVGDFWRTDVALTALLIFLFSLLLLAPTLLSAGLLSPAVLDVLFSLIVVSAAAAASAHRVAAVVASVLAIGTLAIRWLHFGLGVRALGILDPALGAVALLTFAALVLAQVFRAGPITMHRVRGSVAAYLLFGLSWAAAYELALRVDPQAFRLAGGKDPRLELVYFSFVTLTTVGYGDITPQIPAARSLAIAEALVGQLFPAVLIARLVSMELADRMAAGRDRAS